MKRKSLWLWMIVGLGSVIWVLIRVLPKPSRATYPCQQVAQPIAVSFIAWMLGLFGSTLIMRWACHLFQSKRYMVGTIFFAAALLLCFVTLSDTRDVAASTLKSTATFVPTDPANSPMGNGQGINPGRVVWVYDSLLCDQGSTDGWWWEDERTDPEVARDMMTRAILNITGITDPVEAWDALFKHFNQTKNNQNDVGYQAGDKIAIKINNIFSRSYDWGDSKNNRPSPQMVHALIWHLVNVAGVPEADITFCDCIFYHGDPVYEYCHADFPGVRWAEGDATDRSGYESGPGDNRGTREKVVHDPNCVVHYGDPDLIQIVNDTSTVVVHPTDIEHFNDDNPKTLTLLENYPNPFAASTIIRYSITASADVRLSIYNLKGEKVHTLIDRYQPAAPMKYAGMGVMIMTYV